MFKDQSSLSSFVFNFDTLYSCHKNFLPAGGCFPTDPQYRLATHERLAKANRGIFHANAYSPRALRVPSRMLLAGWPFVVQYQQGVCSKGGRCRKYCDGRKEREHQGVPGFHQRDTQRQRFFMEPFSFN